MSTIAEPAVGRDDNVEQPEQPEQPRREAPPTADAHLGGIDDAIAAAEADAEPEHTMSEETTDGDPRPGSLLAALKAAVPPHAFFKTKSMIPDMIQAVAKVVGADPLDVATYEVIWTTGEGTWQQPGVYQVAWARNGCFCGGHEQSTGYQVRVSAPCGNIEQENLTAGQAIQMLSALRVIH